LRQTSSSGFDSEAFSSPPTRISLAFSEFPEA